MEERRTNKHRLGLGLSVRRGKFGHFSGILWLLQACTQTKFPHSYQECWLIRLCWLTRLLDPQVPTPHFSSRLSLTVANSSLLTALGPCLSSSSSSLVGNLARKSFVWVSHQNRQKNTLTSAHPHLHPQNKCPPSCHSARIHFWIKGRTSIGLL